MPVFKIDLTCSHCGKPFTHKHVSRNRGEAQGYEAWAIDHIDLCPSCYYQFEQEEKKSRLYRILDSYGVSLPSVYGVSEKQILYAKGLRDQYLSERVDNVEVYVKAEKKIMECSVKNSIAYRAYQKKIEKTGLTVEEAIRKVREMPVMKSVSFLMQSGSSEEIIQFIKEQRK